MPFIVGSAHKIDAKRHVLGSIQNTPILLSTSEQPSDDVYELIVTYPAAENVTEFTPGCIKDGTVFAASNLSGNAKPCNCIILETITSGADVRVQLFGICATNLTLTANKDLFVRYGATPLSKTPLLTADANEDMVQCIGRAVNTNTVLIDIQKPEVLL